ncbi:GNAT family N-acetyltransferase [Hazenella sp. IB182357]|uniref:GNAT family N-acetyltransferase n=1 Tax=Polycladospora coralii TaxID=2771432 RepID=A0A926N8U6_9BACL|nr:GNAT family N-acetyltransferase [Polycladospora coralii]MBD1371487.1 GNAT family N-acetyltransferase [Polycladospora coralii]
MTVVLETERLILRPFDQKDATDVQRLAGDAEIAKTTLSIPHPYEDGVAKSWIDSLHKFAQFGTMFGFAIVNKENAHLYGCMTLQITPQHQHGELAYWLGKPYWNKGYTTEAARALIQHGFHQYDLNRIFARTMTKNIASSQVMLKSGMQFEGVLKQHFFKDGQFEDIAYYGILREDHKK